MFKLLIISLYISIMSRSACKEVTILPHHLSTVTQEFVILPRHHKHWAFNTTHQLGHNGVTILQRCISHD